MTSKREFQVTSRAAQKTEKTARKSKTAPVISVDPRAAKEALRLARGRDVHVEVIDSKTVIIKNGRR